MINLIRSNLLDLHPHTKMLSQSQKSKRISDSRTVALSQLCVPHIQCGTSIQKERNFLSEFCISWSEKFAAIQIVPILLKVYNTDTNNKQLVFVKILISLKVLEIMDGWVSRIPWLADDKNPDLLLWLVSSTPSSLSSCILTISFQSFYSEKSQRGVIMYIRVKTCILHSPSILKHVLGVQDYNRTSQQKHDL